jgi:copper transport protein
MLLAGAQPASAHAVLVSTDPAQNTVLPTAPARISLTFSESVQVAADGVRVFGPDGQQTDTGQITQPGGDSTAGVGLRSGAAQGTYTVSWHAVSADSHPVAGAFTFSIGHPSAARSPAAAEPTPSTTVSVLYAIARALAYAMFALLVGSAAFVLICLPGAAATRPIRRVMTTGWAGLLLATVVCLLLQGPYGQGLGLSHTFDSAVISETMAGRLGTALQARFLLLGLAGAYLALLSTWLPVLKPKGRWAFGVAGSVLAFALGATWAAADHAAVGLQPELALPVDVVHLTAMGLWLGGLVTLLASFKTEIDLSSAAHRFSRVAAGSVVVLIASGSYQAWRQLGSWSSWFSTGYGRLLLIKVIVFACLLGAAALSRRWVIRRLTKKDSPSVLRRSVLVEAGLAAVVLAVTALLVNSEPGRTASAAPAGPAHREVGYDTGGPGGKGKLEVDVDPSATGPNTLRVVIEDVAGKPRDIPEFHASLTLEANHIGPLPLTMQRVGVGSYSGTGVQIPAAGSWRLALTVRTSEIDETTVATPIDVR